MHACDAISPELVLVCPELRTLAAAHAYPVDEPISAPAPAAPPQRAATLSSRLPNAPLAVGTVAAIAYAVAAFVH